MKDQTSNKRRARATTGVSRYILTVENESGTVLRAERESGDGVAELPVDELLSRIQAPAGGGAPSIVVYVNGDPSAVSVRAIESMNRDVGEITASIGPLKQRLWRILPPPTTVKPLKGAIKKVMQKRKG
jgi:hypothetical protein